LLVFDVVQLNETVNQLEGMLVKRTELMASVNLARNRILLSAFGTMFY